MAAICGMFSAQAQNLQLHEDQVADGTDIPTIIVTAQRRSENVADQRR